MKKKLKGVLKQAKPYLAVIVLRFLAAGLIVIAKIALNKGMSPQVYSLYRYCVAAIVVAPFAVVFNSSVVVPNTYFSGLKYVTPTFSIAISNAVPALSFFLAWIFRMEKVDIRRFSSQAKILGTVVAVGGAMIMTLVRGPSLIFPWTKLGDFPHQYSSTPTTSNNQDSFKGVILVTISCVCASLSCILQGIIISGLSYYVQGVVLEEKGPVFLTAFFPLTTAIVAIISSFAVSEILSLGKVLGAVITIIGLYLVLWGKSKDPAIGKAANSSQTFETTDHQQLKAVDDVSRSTSRDGSV